MHLAVSLRSVYQHVPIRDEVGSGGQTGRLFNVADARLKNIEWSLSMNSSGLQQLSLLLHCIDPLAAKIITFLPLALSSLSHRVGFLHLRPFRKSPTQAGAPSCSKARSEQSPFLFLTTQA